MEKKMSFFGISFVFMVFVMVSINAASIFKQGQKKQESETGVGVDGGGGVGAGRRPQLETTQFQLKWIKRSEWKAKTARQVTPINDAKVPFVIIHHTATPECQTKEHCKATIRSIQHSHMVDRGWDDIGYNFLIGGVSSPAPDTIEIYEGRGFNSSGAHAAGYNQRSVGIALIGNWADTLPPRKMLDVVQQLINYGLQNGFIERNYSLLGHRQVKATECPGKALFNELRQWPHFKH